MNAEIIAIGSELLLAKIIDTNSPYIAKNLADHGIELVQISIVGDDLSQIREAVQNAVRRSQIIITTGGIGPTEDDRTREAIAQTTKRPLIFQPHLMEQIENLIKRRGFRMVENNRIQAYIPEGAIPIENPKGTAPGFIIESPTWVIISIPGVPLEMRYLMEHTIVPYLRKRFSLQHQVIQNKVLRTCGLGESAIGHQIKDLMKESKNPVVGTLASIGDIKISITAKAVNHEEASIMVRKMEEEIRNRLGILIYGVDNETLHGNITKELERLDFTLSIVETFTSGIISQKLCSTNSHSFAQGMLLPFDLAQMRFLNTTEEEFSALSKDPNRLTDQLAMNAKEKFKTDFGLATFGKILEEQKKGEYSFETYYSLSTPFGIEKQRYALGGEPEVVRERASIIALDMLRKYLLKTKK